LGDFYGCHNLIVVNGCRNSTANHNVNALVGKQALNKVVVCVASGRKCCKHYRVRRTRRKRVVYRDGGCARRRADVNATEFARIPFDLSGGGDSGVISHNGPYAGK